VGGAAAARASAATPSRCRNLSQRWTPQPAIANRPRSPGPGRPSTVNNWSGGAALVSWIDLAKISLSWARLGAHVKHPGSAGHDEHADVLRTAAASGSMVSVYRSSSVPTCVGSALSERPRPTQSRCWRSTSSADRRSSPRLFDLDDATRVEVGGSYQEALHLVAGPPPTR